MLYSNHKIGKGDFMPISKAQQRAVSKYVKKMYEDVRFRVTKGKRAVIQAHAQSQGESVNAFLNRAVDETMERDRQKQE